MKNYVKPMMESEAFAANEYIAACGDSGVVYKFECNAGGGVHGSVYQETNGRPGFQSEFFGIGGDKELTNWPMRYYHACNEKHEADSTDDFVSGYYFPNNNSRDVQQVIIWRGPNGDDIHCTTNLNQDSWETAKS